MGMRHRAATRSRKSTLIAIVRFVMTAFVVTMISVRIASAQTEQLPNILVILSDHMGYSDIGPYGSTDINTPALDSIAEFGVRFTNYYSASPVCSPSRAALLSGMYPIRVGVESAVGNVGGLSSEDSTLVRELKTAGYRTGMFGKWHLGRGEGYSPLAHGFDEFYGFYDWTLGYHTHLNSLGDRGLYRQDTLVDDKGYLTDLLTREAVQFIADSSDRPFFAYLAYNVGLPPYQGRKLPEDQWESGWDVNEASREDYVAMVEAMDEGIGRVLDVLDERGLAENTLVVFAYDHGGQDLVHSGPLFHGFSTLWEGGIRVPLLMRWPQEFGSKVVIDRPSIAMDITATILEAAGRDTGSLDLDGSSLLPLLADGETVPAETLFWRYRGPRGPTMAVRQGDWKYVRDVDAQFLFDLDADIGERSNRFSDRQDIADELREELRNWVQSSQN